MPSSRLAPARRRARLVKAASAGAALAGFGLVAVVVRGANPGAAPTSQPANIASLPLSTRISQEAKQSNAFFSSGSVQPSPSPSPPIPSSQQSQPQASTQTS